MASFSFTSPTGQSYTVDGPDGATPAQAFQILQQHLGNPAPQPQVGMGEDVAKSAASGLENATAGILGAPSDLSNLLAKGSKLASDYIANKLGYESSPGITRPLLPTSQDILSTATNPVVSPDYQPQSALGGIAKTGAEFLPSVIGGPESIGSKLLTRVAAPTLASEAAGALTSGTEAEPYARAAAAILGGAGADKAARVLAEQRAIASAVPALNTLKSDTSSGYDALTARNVAQPIPQSTLDNLASDIKTTLNNKGIRPSVADNIHKAVEEIRTPATAGAADVADLVAARQNVKNLLSSPDANKAGAAITLGKIDNAIESASPGTMTQIRELDKNWSAVKANEALDKRLARAELRAAGEHSGTNIGNKIRQQVTNYLVSNEAKYLSPENIADLKKIVKGTVSQNAMRAVSNLLGGGGGLGMLAAGGAGYEAGGVPGAIAAGLAGRGLKIANNRAVIRQAERVAQNIRMRSPMGQAALPTLPLPASNPLVTAVRTALLARPK